MQNFADNVQLIEELQNDEILSILQFLRKERLLFCYHILNQRGYKLNGSQLRHFYYAIQECMLIPQHYEDLWNISNNLEPEEQEIFFKFLDRTFFSPEYTNMVLSKFANLANSELLDVYLSRCIEIKSPSVYRLYSYLYGLERKDKCLSLIPTILQLKDFTKPIYIWEKIFDLVPDSEQLLDEDGVPKEFIEAYTLYLMSLSSYQEASRAKFTRRVNALMRKRTVPSDQMMKSFVKSGASLDEEIFRYFVLNYVDKVLKERPDVHVNQELTNIFRRFSNFKHLLISHVVKNKRTLYPALLAAVSSLDDKTEIVQEICTEIPDVHLKLPIFYITQFHTALNNLPKIDFVHFTSELRKSLNKLNLAKLEEDEKIKLNYCLNEGLQLQERGVLRDFLYDFFLSEIDFFMKMREFLSGETRYIVIKESEKLISRFLEKWNNDAEIQFLASFIGISQETFPNVGRSTVESILDRIDKQFEVILVYYFTKKNLNESTLRENFRGFIVNHDFQSFGAIVIKRLLELKNPTESLVLNQLNKAFQEGYHKFAKVKKMERDQYFTLNTLVRQCHGRSWSAPTTDEDDFTFGNTEFPTKYCEGRFWGHASEIDKFSKEPGESEVYWCRGNECFQPNRKSNFDADFTQYSICEIAESFSEDYTDLLYATIAGWANRIEEIILRLWCRKCRSNLYPITSIPIKLGHYSTPVFNCLNKNCSEHEKTIRITHCIKCRKLIDSRDADKCSNGWLICHDKNCRGCCDIHTKVEIKPIIRQQRKQS